MNVFLHEPSWRKYEELPIVIDRAGEASPEPISLTERRVAFLRSRRVRPFVQHF